VFQQQIIPELQLVAHRLQPAVLIQLLHLMPAAHILHKE